MATFDYNRPANSEGEVYDMSSMRQAAAHSESLFLEVAPSRAQFFESKDNTGINKVGVVFPCSLADGGYGSVILDETRVIAVLNSNGKTRAYRVDLGQADDMLDVVVGKNGKGVHVDMTAKELLDGAGKPPNLRIQPQTQQPNVHAVAGFDVPVDLSAIDRGFIDKQNTSARRGILNQIPAENIQNGPKGNKIISFPWPDSETGMAVVIAPTSNIFMQKNKFGDGYSVNLGLSSMAIPIAVQKNGQVVIEQRRAGEIGYRSWAFSQQQSAASLAKQNDDRKPVSRSTAASKGNQSERLSLVVPMSFLIKSTDASFDGYTVDFSDNGTPMRLDVPRETIVDQLDGDRVQLDIGLTHDRLKVKNMAVGNRGTISAGHMADVWGSNGNQVMREPQKQADNAKVLNVEPVKQSAASEVLVENVVETHFADGQETNVVNDQPQGSAVEVPQSVDPVETQVQEDIGSQQQIGSVVEEQPQLPEASAEVHAQQEPSAVAPKVNADGKIVVPMLRSEDTIPHADRKGYTIRVPWDGADGGKASFPVGKDCVMPATDNAGAIIPGRYDVMLPPDALVHVRGTVNGVKTDFGSVSAADIVLKVESLQADEHSLTVVPTLAISGTFSEDLVKDVLGS